MGKCESVLSAECESLWPVWCEGLLQCLGLWSAECELLRCRVLRPTYTLSGNKLHELACTVQFVRVWG